MDDAVAIADEHLRAAAAEMDRAAAELADVFTFAPSVGDDLRLARVLVERARRRLVREARPVAA